MKRPDNAPAAASPYCARCTGEFRIDEDWVFYPERRVYTHVGCLEFPKR